MEAYYMKKRREEDPMAQFMGWADNCVNSPVTERVTARCIFSLKTFWNSAEKKLPLIHKVDKKNMFYLQNLSVLAQWV
jgi:hypothetical protein